jgi:hypothetical protein
MRVRRAIAVGLLCWAGAGWAQEGYPPAGTVAAEAPPRPPAEVTATRQDLGWDARWALLFGLNNVLVVPGILGDANSPVGGVAGAALFLAPDLALRAGLRVSRGTQTGVVQEQVTEIGEERIVSLTHSRPSPTATGQVALSADVLHRLSERAVAPYLGGGLYAAWARSETKWRDEVTSPDIVTSADDASNVYSVGAQGLVGAEWRVHPSFSFFAEYGLRLNVFSRVEQRERRIDENPADGGRVAQSTRSNRNEWLNLSSGLLWGGQLGLLVHFL